MMVSILLTRSSLECCPGKSLRGACCPKGGPWKVLSASLGRHALCSRFSRYRRYEMRAQGLVSNPLSAAAAPRAHANTSGWFFRINERFGSRAPTHCGLHIWDSSSAVPAKGHVAATSCTSRLSAPQKSFYNTPHPQVPVKLLAESATSARTSAMSDGATAAVGHYIESASQIGIARSYKTAVRNEGTDKAEDIDAAISGPEPSYVKLNSGFHLLQCKEGFEAAYGGYLSTLDIAYETWGTLNAAKSNAVLLTCGLSASSHAKSSPSNSQEEPYPRNSVVNALGRAFIHAPEDTHSLLRHSPLFKTLMLPVSPGWWEAFIGSGLALDTDRFFIVCVANLGSCYGTTGPSSFCSSMKTGKAKRYGLNFPLFSVQDMVRVMFKVIDHLEIKSLHAVVGSSLGGMQSLAAAVMYPHRVNRVVSISAAAASSPLSIALRFAQRQVLMADPAFRNGEYYESAYPVSGMKLAREIATITYRSGPEWSQRFGRQRVTQRHTVSGSAEGNRTPEEKQGVLPSPSLGVDFTVEAYLEHQGKKWCHVYDPNSMLLISKAMDLFSLAEIDPDTGDYSLAYGLRGVRMPALIVGVQSDILFPLWQQKQMANALRDSGNKSVAFYTLDSIYGHDTFLIDVANVGAALKGHVEQSHA